MNQTLIGKFLADERKKKGYTQKQAVLIMYGITAILGMFAIILLESGIWKALSFALLICAIIAIGYKDIVRVITEDSKKDEDIKCDESNSIFIIYRLKNIKSCNDICIYEKEKLTLPP